MAALVDKAVSAIIRPPRHEYKCDELPVLIESEDGKKFLRHPVSFMNERGQKLVGSIYHRVGLQFDGGPCIMYLHGNASSQCEGQFLVPNVCPYNIYVFCFDFAGCGCSEGEFVSLGYFETMDVQFLIGILHQNFNLGPFILWGRSMGASTTLLVDNPYVIAKISDSAFTSIPDMCGAIAISMSLPAMFVPAVVWFLKREVIKHANFDLESVSPLTATLESCVPVVFGHAEEDKFIPFEQCRILYNHYGNPMKFLMALPGGHNSKRQYDWIKLGVSFALDQFGVIVKNLVVSECRTLQSSTFHFSSFNDMVKTSEEKEPQARGFEATQVIERYEEDVASNAQKPAETTDNDKKKKNKDDGEQHHHHHHHKDKDGEKHHHHHKKKSEASKVESPETAKENGPKEESTEAKKDSISEEESSKTTENGPKAEASEAKNDSASSAGTSEANKEDGPKIDNSEIQKENVQKAEASETKKEEKAGNIEKEIITQQTEEEDQTKDDSENENSSDGEKTVRNEVIQLQKAEEGDNTRNVPQKAEEAIISQSESQNEIPAAEKIEIEKVPDVEEAEMVDIDVQPPQNYSVVMPPKGDEFADE